MDIADRIRALREDSDKTQTEIAQILNVCQRTYADYELRKIRIPIDSAIILARFYNVAMNYICGLTDRPSKFTQ